MTTDAIPIRPPDESFWRRRIVTPIRVQLTLGVTPDRVAATLAVGTVCSLFPFLGATSALNLVVGLGLRMNQLILQTLNQLLGPLQLIMVIVYVRAGERIWRAQGDRFSVVEMIRSFHRESLVGFLRAFGWAGVHAFTAWILTAPLLGFILYRALRPVMRRIGASMKTTP